MPAVRVRRSAVALLLPAVDPEKMSRRNRIASSAVAQLSAAGDGQLDQIALRALPRGIVVLTCVKIPRLLRVQKRIFGRSRRGKDIPPGLRSQIQLIAQLDVHAVSSEQDSVKTEQHKLLFRWYYSL